MSKRTVGMIIWQHPESGKFHTELRSADNRHGLFDTWADTKQAAIDAANHAAYCRSMSVAWTDDQTLVEKQGATK